MSRNLVIVESPAKAKTIKKYLGKDFEVMASYGHVRDLVPKEGAVDPTRRFAMRWELIDKNRKHVDAIARAVKKADALYLSTDPDREGEAISWHLYELLKDAGALDGKAVHRSVFYEITQGAVQEAIDQPREIAEELVKAYLARRALDFLVGFNISPLLWKKAGLSGASAGRVQSPALRMICEREEEIAAFKPREYWTVDAEAEKATQAFNARLTEYDGTKVEQFTITSAAQADEVRRRLDASAGGELTVAAVDKKQRKRNPSPPFTTSTLQQEAARKLGFGAQRTMRTAQRLYEGVDFGEGPVGLITYMRTDSVSLAVEAVREIRSTIGALYGAAALPEAPRTYRTKSKNAQEAHEAIRPTSSARYARAARRPARRRPAPALHARLAARGSEPDGGRGLRHRRRRPGGRPGPHAARERLDAGEARVPGRLSRELRRRHARRRREPDAARDGDRRPREAPRDQARAALHRAAAALLGGEPGQGARGVRHRPPLDLCQHHPDAALQEVLRAPEPALRADGPRQDRESLPHRQLRALRGLRLHGLDGGPARQHLARRGGLGRRCSIASGAASRSRSTMSSRT